MNKSLLDTDILSEVLKARDKTVAANATAYRQAFGQYTISAISVMEIVKGFHKVQRADALQQFANSVATMEVLPLGQGSAEITGRILADLERDGQPVGFADAMVAGIALYHELPLVTGNTRHFQRIQVLGYPLQLENWREPQNGIST